MEVSGQSHALVAVLRERELVTNVWGAGWAPQPVWMGVENLAPTGIRSLYRPASR